MFHVQWGESWIPAQYYGLGFMCSVVKTGYPRSIAIHSSPVQQEVGQRSRSDINFDVYVSCVDFARCWTLEADLAFESFHVPLVPGVGDYD